VVGSCLWVGWWFWLLWFCVGVFLMGAYADGAHWPIM
jgi:hypothetical protein